MGENSAIEWTTHTFNPWIGCTHVSEGCRNCYAETLMDKRYGKAEWGVGKPRILTSESNWRQPLAWQRRAERSPYTCPVCVMPKTGRNDPGACHACGTVDIPNRPRVFCSSLADVFDTEVPDEWRDRLFVLIHATPNLDWLLLTKRPENALRYMTKAQEQHIIRARDHRLGHTGDLRDPLPLTAARRSLDFGISHFPHWRNAWIGVSVENQAAADERIPLLLQTPAAVRFLSVEPLLGPVTFRWAKWDDHSPNPRRLTTGHINHLDGLRMLDWIIVGGESGPSARPCNVAWIRAVIEQCREAGVSVFAKQLGANVIDRNDVGFEGDLETFAGGPDDGKWVNPSAWPHQHAAEDRIEHLEPANYQGAPVRVHLRDRKGGNWDEWPMDLRVREFPREVRS